MDLKEKELLLKDLSARLSYGVKIHIESCGEIWDDILDSISIGKVGSTPMTYINRTVILENCVCKPYLRPMSSMTEEEIKELSKIDMKRLIFSSRHLTWNLDGEIIDYLNKKMFDWRGLIHLGLAIDCTNMGIYD